MSSPRKSPLPAQAADLLSADLKVRIRKVVRLLAPAVQELDARFRKTLARRGFTPDQSNALAAVTAGAAAQILVRRKPLGDFFEQVEYSGRRLAKLDVAPGTVVEALAAFDRLLARAAHGPEAAEVRWVADQLNFCALLTLNNAFYQVREAETEAFFELHDVELEAANSRELMDGYLRVLARFARADVAAWVLAGSPEAASAELDALAEPMVFRAANGHARLLLDRSWTGACRTVWSIPLGGGAGVMQFGFRREYSWLPRELRLLTGAAARCASVLDKLRLTGELAAREQQVRELAIRMVETEERERRRIRRELHDETAQILPYLRLQLEMLERGVPEELAELRRGLAEAQALIGRTVAEIRRVLSDLSPVVLDQLGLAAAVRQLLNRLRQAHGVGFQLDVTRLGAAPKDIEWAAYRLIQECCNNVGRHSSASHLNVSLSTADGKLKMRIEDNGVGFRVEDALAKDGSFGLAGMRERVALAGGRFDLWSRPGRGTRIAAEIPVPPAAKDEKTVSSRAGNRRKTGDRAWCA